ncbi:type III secretion protein HrpB4 [Burkholderia metallica]|uniref:type III secretion protein HrpB4 n=1 Tax=Burkholderia metallica TaxID=488729 RepID=UPI001CF164BD|nr:type III secretion protein HrpB4 [Burkholderia metallica]MCA8002723.1 type III secretion protein [Burkholderia metallica]
MTLSVAKSIPIMSARDALRSMPNADGALTTEEVAQLLLGWQRNIRTAAQWIHDDWLAHALGVEPKEAASRNGVTHRGDFAELLKKMRTQCDEACSLAIMRVLMPEAPTLDTWLTDPVARFDTLPIETGLSLLRMQALIARRAEVRRLVDRSTRSRLSEWIGCSLDDLFGRSVADALPPFDGGRELTSTRTLSALEIDELGMEGFVLLPRSHADKGGRAEATRVVSRSLLRLALPYRTKCEVPLPSYDACAEAFQLLRERLGIIFPEHAWLFG